MIEVLNKVDLVSDEFRASIIGNSKQDFNKREEREHR